MRQLTRLVLMVGLTGSLSCYKFEPATVDAVPQGSTIRAVLSPTASDWLRERHGINGRQLAGTVMADNGEAFSLWIASVPLSPEFGARPLYQQVDILKADVLRVDLRRLDTGKTAMILAGGAAALVVVGRATFLGGGRGSGPGPGPGPGEHVRSWLVPLLLGRF